MYYFLHDIRYITYGTWALVFVGRLVLNFILYYREQDLFEKRGGELRKPDFLSRRRYNEHDFFVSFTFHWGHDIDDTDSIRKLKRFTNRLHIFFVFYSIFVVFFWIYLYANQEL